MIWGRLGVPCSFEHLFTSSLSPSGFPDLLEGAVGFLSTLSFLFSASELRGSVASGLSQVVPLTLGSFSAWKLVGSVASGLSQWFLDSQLPFSASELMGSVSV